MSENDETLYSEAFKQMQHLKTQAVWGGTLKYYQFECPRRHRSYFQPGTEDRNPGLIQMKTFPKGKCVHCGLRNPNVK